jgi:2'-5' RNA ligase
MSRSRTFIAIEMDPLVRREAQRQVQKLEATAADVRWVQPQHMHLTIKFLGDVDDLELPEICRAVSQVAQATPPFSLACRGMGAFPNLQRPRTIWMGLADTTGRLAELHRQLEHRLSELGFRAENRQFVPHLTLGRVRQAGPQLAEVARQLQADADRTWGTSVVDELIVFASQLTPQGPIHTPVCRAELEGQE